MNKARRKTIADIANRLATLREELSAVTEAEQEAFDNLPESLQYGERGETMQEAISALENATGGMEDIEAELDDFNA